MTKRQRECFVFIVGFLAQQGYNPSYGEIAKAMKLRSLATVHKHIHALRRRGYVEVFYNTPRSVAITPKGKRMLKETVNA